MSKNIPRSPIEFLKSSNFLRTWTPCEGQPCEMEGVRLSMARPAPAVRRHHPSVQTPPRPAQEPPPARPRQNEDPWVNLALAIGKVAGKASDFKAWLDSPPPPPAPAPPPAPQAPAVRKVPPFDIQDVPKAMRQLGMPMAARLQERWFSGYENYSRSASDLRDEIDQHGVPYARAMVDDTTIKMDWVLSFPRAKKALDDLIKTDVRSPKALDALKAILGPYRHRHDLMAWNETGSALLAFHRKFQFQLIKVNATWGQRVSSFLERSLTAEGVPDDLTGALGSFNIFAAVRYARFEANPASALVTDLLVYVRDPYEFSDDQYLGHWNSSHVAVVPAHHLAAGSGWLQYPVTQGNVYAKDAVLYPVINKDYRDWRAKHNQGGDFMIYTRPIGVKLDSPIRVVF